MILTGGRGHRSNLAFAVGMRRVGDYGLRAARTRLFLVGSILVAVAVFDPGWAALIIATVATVATYLSTSDNYYTRHKGEPKEPLARLSHRVNLITLGRNRPNVPGIFEALMYIPLACIGPWLIPAAPTAVQVICFAAALGYVASCVCAVFTDPAFYNPESEPPVIEDIIRMLAGPITAIAAAVIALTSPLDAQTRLISLGFCAALCLIQLRIAETDRTLNLAREWANDEQMRGRRTVVEILHSELGPEMSMLYQAARSDPTINPRFWELTRSAVMTYRALQALDFMADIDVDWPGTLLSQLRLIQGLTGTRFDLTIPPDHHLGRNDRVLARTVLDDLASNAAKSGATDCAVTLDYDSGTGRYRATVIDNGRPILPGVWLQPGSASYRLRQSLLDTGYGELTLATLDDQRKQAVAVWSATPTATTREDA